MDICLVYLQVPIKSTLIAPTCIIHTFDDGGYTILKQNMCLHLHSSPKTFEKRTFQQMILILHFSKRKEIYL